MTEDEAREKWCPMVQVTSAQHMNDIEYGDNRGGGDENHNCIASDCMCWRWGQRLEDGEFCASDTYGYCGLAGKP